MYHIGKIPAMYTENIFS